MIDTQEDSVELLTSPWSTRFYDLVNLAEEELFLVSPFLGNRPLAKVSNLLSEKQASRQIRVNIVTNLAVDSLINGSLDVSALLSLVQTIPNSTVVYLPSLHAKMYIADTKAAVITSANLTTNGLSGNHEYGVLLRDKKLVLQIKNDMSLYSSLGSKVSLETLTSLKRVTQELQIVRQQVDKSIKSKVKAAFEQQTETAKLELLRVRAEGKTTHGIFSETVLYLLNQKGPLTTIELHPLVQQIHPDLCDDTMDRVINDVHFGKKWKHYVRNVQQALKRSGEIGFDGQRWYRIK